MALRKTCRVSRRNPCPICERPDWCLAARDGRYAICMRVPSDRPARGQCGGWFHRLAGCPLGRPEESSPTVRANRVPHLAPIDHRDRVYSRLLAVAQLGEAHAQDLRRRGFSEEEMAARQYKSLPLLGRSRLARQVQEADPGSLDCVPGFFVAYGDTGFPYHALAGRPGLLIPCRDATGRIRALRIRPDDPGKSGGKYCWLSSIGKPGGAGSGSHSHVARPVGGKSEDETVWITEGELKADLAAERLKAVVLSVPGVTSWSKTLPDLVELLPRGGRVVVAFDADWPDKPQVHHGLWFLSQACLALGYQTEVATWLPTYKGLDDLLTAGHYPRHQGYAGAHPRIAFFRWLALLKQSKMRTLC